jgi:hypothetical protein
MIVEKQMECRLAGETEVLGENLPQRHFCPSQNMYEYKTRIFSPKPTISVNANIYFRLVLMCSKLRIQNQVYDESSFVL